MEEKGTCGAKVKKILYCTPAMYLAGGVERVLTTKANFLADEGYDVTIILTEGKGKGMFFSLSEKVKVVNLDIGFEEMWNKPFLHKVLLYLKKQRVYKLRLREALMEIRPDITISTLRREINFITGIPDGSKKIGELHINRQNYRNFEAGDTNVVKRLFGQMWMAQLVRKLKRLDRMVVLTEEDAAAWSEISKISVIPNPLSVSGDRKMSTLEKKKVIAVGRYAPEKGYDLLLTAWKKVEMLHPDWSLYVYGAGESRPYYDMGERLGLKNCHLCDSAQDIWHKYADSSIFVCSSRFEGFGMAIVEAMSSGLPVVSFDCPCGPASIVDNQKNGLLISNGDTDALAEGIVQLIESPEKRQLFAKAAIEKAALYDISVIGKQWEKLFETI